MANRVVLVVEDNPEMLQFLRDVLTHECQADVVTTRDGETALEMARVQRPAVVLLDLFLSGLGSVDVCRRLKASPITRNILVVALTGVVQYDLVRQVALRARCDVVIHKLYSFHRLVPLVRNALDSGLPSLETSPTRTHLPSRAAGTRWSDPDVVEALSDGRHAHPPLRYAHADS